MFTYGAHSCIFDHLVIGLSGVQFRDNRASNFKSLARLSLNCTPLIPITSTNILINLYPPNNISKHGDERLQNKLKKLTKHSDIYTFKLVPTVIAGLTDVFSLIIVAYIWKYQCNVICYPITVLSPRNRWYWFSSHQTGQMSSFTYYPVFLVRQRNHRWCTCLEDTTWLINNSSTIPVIELEFHAVA